MVPMLLVRMKLLDTSLRQSLLDVAWQSIYHGLECSAPLLPTPDDYPEALRECHGSFVTLTKEDRLRGCIGTLEATRPLVEDTAPAKLVKKGMVPTPNLAKKPLGAGLATAKPLTSIPP